MATKSLTKKTEKVYTMYGETVIYRETVIFHRRGFPKYLGTMNTNIAPTAIQNIA